MQRSRTRIRRLRRSILAPLAVAFAVGLLVAPSAIGAGKPSIGAIRWDYWAEDNPDMAPFSVDRLRDPLWHLRIPFYGNVRADGSVVTRGNNQRVIDREIALAANAGIDYWAFDYHPARDGHSNYGLELFLTSKRRHRLDFSLIVMSGGLGHSTWKQDVAYLLDYFQQAEYQTVIDGRPLLYMFVPDDLSKDDVFGSPKQARDALGLLRDASRDQGTGDPYIVGLVFDAETGSRNVESYGLDAIGSYSAWGGSAKPTSTGHPYSKLVRENIRFWRESAATGYDVVPNVMAGWDPRPLQELEAYNPGGAPLAWFKHAKPKQVARNIVGSLDWTCRHRRQAPAQTVLVYAWNEFSEGGWLTPDHGEGSARLDAISAALRPPSSAHTCATAHWWSSLWPHG